MSAFILSLSFSFYFPLIHVASAVFSSTSSSVAICVITRHLATTNRIHVRKKKRPAKAYTIIKLVKAVM